MREENVVREIVPDDGIRWIALIKLGDVNWDAEEKFILQSMFEQWTAERFFRMRSENRYDGVYSTKVGYSYSTDILCRHKCKQSTWTSVRSHGCIHGIVVMK
jgi:hypothetical protein